MSTTIGYAATMFNRTLKPKKFERAAPGAGDVELDLTFCGVCHSDIHQVDNDWKNTVWPCVPGHELVGTISKIGTGVTQFKVGDLVAVGCMVDSCGVCYSCDHGDEQYCESETGFLGTYNGPKNPTLQNSYGGYSNKFVVKEHFLLKVPAGIPAEAAGPILCAGVTTYSPLKRWITKPGMKVGIIGLGGLGHMGVQIAKALGAEVTVISTTAEKVQDAMTFGATRFVLSTDKDQMKNASASLDLLLNTIPEKHDIAPYLELLHRDGSMVIVGDLEGIPALNTQKIVMERKLISGSLIGSIAETEAVLEFCAQNNILPRTELIAIQDINDAYKKIKNKEARYRYVIDLASLGKEDIESLDEIKEVSHLLDKSKKAKMPVPEIHIGNERSDYQPSAH